MQIKEMRNDLEPSLFQGTENRFHYDLGSSYADVVLNWLSTNTYINMSHQFKFLCSTLFCPTWLTALLASPRYEGLQCFGGKALVNKLWPLLYKRAELGLRLTKFLTMGGWRGKGTCVSCDACSQVCKTKVFNFVIKSKIWFFEKADQGVWIPQKSQMFCSNAYQQRMHDKIRFGITQKNSFWLQK